MPLYWQYTGFYSVQSSKEAQKLKAVMKKLGKQYKLQIKMHDKEVISTVGCNRMQ